MKKAGLLSTIALMFATSVAAEQNTIEGMKPETRDFINNFSIGVFDQGRVSGYAGPKNMPEQEWLEHLKDLFSHNERSKCFRGALKQQYGSNELPLDIQEVIPKATWQEIECECQGTVNAQIRFTVKPSNPTCLQVPLS